MIFELHCGDVMPGCPAHFRSEDRDRLVHEVATHAAAEHGVSDLTPELTGTIQSHLHVVSTGGGDRDRLAHRASYRP